MQQLWMKRWLLLLTTLLVSGCASMVTERMTHNLASAILNQDDPETVRAGAPAYLLLVDGLIEGNPTDLDMLQAGARLYGAYAVVFVEDQARARRLANKAWGYAERQLCVLRTGQCNLRKLSFEDFEKALQTFSTRDLPFLFSYATAWAIRIQVHSDDWTAIAELAKAEAMMERVVQLKEAFEEGQAHFYLGLMRSSLPPAMGGKPELARMHFERAIELSHGRNLIAKVEYARHYARMLFDRPLHDRLLNEVIAADPVADGFTLSNILAQRQALELLASASDYFLE